MTDYQECMICFEPLKNEVAVISCGHQYHFDCIKQYKKKQLPYNIKYAKEIKYCCVCNKVDEIVNVVDIKKKTKKKKLIIVA